VLIMTDEQSTQVLDFLREQFARMDARFDKSDRRQREMLAQLVRIETGQGKLRRDQADDAATVIELQGRVVEMDERVTRIERRLGLVDEPMP
jgi:hypothetical protein